MQEQTNSTPHTIQGQPSATQGQAPRPATGLHVKTHLKAGMMLLQALMGGQMG
jgi:hypothetical protein